MKYNILQVHIHNLFFSVGSCHQIDITFGSDLSNPLVINAKDVNQIKKLNLNYMTYFTSTLKY